MKEKFEKLTNLINDMCNEKYFPGATYAVCNHDSIYTGVVGKKAIIPKIEENSIDTLYDMASLTKVIVTNTILTRLIAKGKINLTDKIDKYLPQYDYLNITIYDLVTHSSGLGADFDIPNIHSNDDFEFQLSNIKKEYETGTKVIYSDQGFVLLGMVLEQIYNKPLDQIAKEEVFIPLDMKDATFYPDKEKCAPTELTKERGLVRGKTHDEKGYYSNKIIGHAGLFCSINDLTNFTNMVLNDGVFNNQVYLEKKYLDLWFTPCNNYNNITRSIGWILGEASNVTGSNVSENTICHTGFTGTSIVIDKDNDFSVIVLTNRVHPTRENTLLVKARKYFVEAVLDEQKRAKF